MLFDTEKTSICFGEKRKFTIIFMSTNTSIQVTLFYLYKQTQKKQPLKAFNLMNFQSSVMSPRSFQK